MWNKPGINLCPPNFSSSDFISQHFLPVLFKHLCDPGALYVRPLIQTTIATQKTQRNAKPSPPKKIRAHSRNSRKSLCFIRVHPCPSVVKKFYAYRAHSRNSRQTSVFLSVFIRSGLHGLQTTSEWLPKPCCPFVNPGNIRENSRHSRQSFCFYPCPSVFIRG